MLLLSIPHSVTQILEVLGDSFRCTLDQVQWKTTKAISQFEMCSAADPVKAETATTILFGLVFPQQSRHFSSSLFFSRPPNTPQLVYHGLHQAGHGSQKTRTNNDSKEK